MGKTIITSIKPMMASEEIKIIDNIIEDRKPEYCLEFGSGGSTIYFPKKHKYIKNWLSIEHVGRYCEFLRDKISKKVNLIWVLENENQYINCVRYNIETYDFILIDGKMRNECIKLSLRLLKKGGIALLHDAGRSEYDTSCWKNKKLLIQGELKTKKGDYAHRGLMSYVKT